MVCSKNFDRNDIVLLEEAKSAFVSHNPVEASKFTPKMLIWIIYVHRYINHNYATPLIYVFST